jgi:hypothetical protein
MAARIQAEMVKKIAKEIVKEIVDKVVDKVVDNIAEEDAEEDVSTCTKRWGVLLDGISDKEMVFDYGGCVLVY